jgi:hypothetical protein
MIDAREQPSLCAESIEKLRIDGITKQLYRDALSESVVRSEKNIRGRTRTERAHERISGPT